MAYASFGLSRNTFSISYGGISFFTASHSVLVTPGRGTPLGGAVPTVKIASNDSIATQKPHWIDFSAYGSDKDAKADELLKLIKRVADGEMTKNEILGNREIAIFKDGVTL